MTYDEITLWRRFMQSKATLNNFEYLYHSHRFDKRDLEQYLEETDAEDVLLSAFDFSGAGNTIFGYQYWKNLDEKWQAKLNSYRCALKEHCVRYLEGLKVQSDEAGWWWMSDFGDELIAYIDNEKAVQVQA